MGHYKKVARGCNPVRCSCAETIYLGKASLSGTSRFLWRISGQSTERNWLRASVVFEKPFPPMRIMDHRVHKEQQTS
jgi:hypothetical protein